MKLFAPNNLSQRHPEFTPLKDPQVTSEIVALLEQQYDLTSLNKICVIRGPNISSQNFKIDTTWFLKSRPKEAREKMLSEARLTFALSELGQKVPRIIRSSSGELVSLYEDRCWVLYKFQEGNYFSGQGNELQAAAEAFGQLSLAAINLFPRSQMNTELSGLAELLERETKYSDVAQL